MMNDSKAIEKKMTQTGVALEQASAAIVYAYAFIYTIQIYFI